MRKLIRPISALGAVFFAAGALAACGGGLSSNAVVNVNGTNISQETFNHWMEVASASTRTSPTSKPVVPVPPNYEACIKHLEAQPQPKGAAKQTPSQLKAQCESQYKALQQEVLGFLTSSQWVLAEAEKLGVKVSDKEVHDQFVKIRSQQFPNQAEFQKFLTNSGQSVSDLLLRVKLNLLSSKIQKKIVEGKGNVTQADVEKYYKENQSRFGTPEKRNVSLVLTKDEAAAKAAKSEIESGKSFAEVAKARSTDPTSKANGGQLSEVVKGQEAKPLDESIFSAQKGQLLGPIKTPFGYYVFRVTSTAPGSQQQLSQVSSSIKAQLKATKQQEALTKFVKEFKTTWKEKTDCRSGYVVANCKQFKAPKTGAGSTSTTAGQ